LIVERRRRERGHPLSVAIARVLEEHTEITIFDLAKDKLARAFRHGRERYRPGSGDVPIPSLGVT
jgi:hypothetical protein